MLKARAGSRLGGEGLQDPRLKERKEQARVKVLGNFAVASPRQRHAARVQIPVGSQLLGPTRQVGHKSVIVMGPGRPLGAPKKRESQGPQRGEQRAEVLSALAVGESHPAEVTPSQAPLGDKGQSAALSKGASAGLLAARASPRRGGS